MIRNWLRAWLGIDSMLSATGSQVLELAQAQLKDSQRFDHIENEIAAQEQAHNAAINELREQLGKPRSRSSMRPFHVQARMAEIGAIAQRAKDGG